jgi:hypothetical protein
VLVSLVKKVWYLGICLTLVSTFIILTAGLSSSLPDQVKQILEVVGTALRSVSSTRRKQALRSHKRAAQKEEEERIAEEIQERVRRGVWHDPRMGAIVGGGAIAELGVGDEPFMEYDEDLVTYSHKAVVPTLPTSKREERSTPDLHVVSTLPTVVLRNYTAGGKEDVMDVFAKWVAALVEGQVRFSCHP